jgi:hypothetical protein
MKPENGGTEVNLELRKSGRRTPMLDSKIQG